MVVPLLSRLGIWGFSVNIHAVSNPWLIIIHFSNDSST